MRPSDRCVMETIHVSNVSAFACVSSPFHRFPMMQLIWLSLPGDYNFLFSFPLHAVQAIPVSHTSQRFELLDLRVLVQLLA